VKGSFISGLLIGLVTGSVVALLSAPQSGEETRQLLSEKKDELKVKAVNTVDDVLNQAEHSMQRARELSQRTLNWTQENIVRLQESGVDMLEEQRTRLSRIMAQMKQ